MARDSRFRDEDPASRDDRSASSARLIGRVETMIRSESRSDVAGSASISSASVPSVAGRSRARCSSSSCSSLTEAWP